MGRDGNICGEQVSADRHYHGHRAAASDKNVWLHKRVTSGENDIGTRSKAWTRADGSKQPSERGPFNKRWRERALGETHAKKIARCEKAQAGPLLAGRGHSEPPGTFPAVRHERVRNPKTKTALPSGSNPAEEPEHSWRRPGRCHLPRRGHCRCPSHHDLPRRAPCESSPRTRAVHVTCRAATGPAPKLSQLFSAVARGENSHHGLWFNR